MRSFTHGHVQQLDAAGGRLLARLTARVPALLADTEQERIAFVDVDDTIRAVHGYAKQAATYRYTRQRGLNIQLATISTTTSAPVIARARLCRGNTVSAAVPAGCWPRRCAPPVTPGYRPPILCRADSAYHGWALVGTALRHDAWFSVTARMDPKVKAAIASISDDAWTTIAYPNAIWEDAEQRWVSDAEVAEVQCTACTGRTKAEHVPCRLVVRRVMRLQPLAGDGSQQGQLFATYRHHAFITNSTLPTVQADQRHRGHAIVEQVIAELKDGPPGAPAVCYLECAVGLGC